MRIAPDPRLPELKGGVFFVAHLTRLLRDIIQQLNGISEGQIQKYHNATTAAPTTGTWAQGDKIWNSTPSEAGSATSKYVIIGWVCTVGGTPGTWLEMRALTGN